MVNYLPPIPPSPNIVDNKKKKKLYMYLLVQIRNLKNCKLKKKWTKRKNPPLTGFKESNPKNKNPSPPPTSNYPLGREWKEKIEEKLCKMKEKWFFISVFFVCFVEAKQKAPRLYWRITHIHTHCILYSFINIIYWIYVKSPFFSLLFSKYLFVCP